MAMVVNKILLFYLFIFITIKSHAQENILKRKINYAAEDQRLESVLLGIANVGDFNFSYNPQILHGDSLINLTVENSSVKDVLDVIFMSRITYKVSGNHLILLKDKPVKVNEKTNFSVSGYVYDARTGKKLFCNPSVFLAVMFIVSLVSQFYL